MLPDLPGTASSSCRFSAEPLGSPNEPRRPGLSASSSRETQVRNMSKLHFSIVRGGRSAVVLTLLRRLPMAASRLVPAPSVSAGPRVVPDGLAPHAPIQIRSDADFTPANGVTGGTGTAADPYIIEGWEINASTAHGIEIRDTTAYFAIRNVSTHSGGPSHFGLYLFNVSHGQVHNATSSGNWFGLALDQSDNVSIAMSNFSANLQGGLNQ